MIQAITTLDLEDLVVSLGVSLTDHTTGAKGIYNDRHRTISIRKGLTERAHRSTLAHELIHAVFRDRLTGLEHLDRKMERRADKLAAELLITKDDYVDAESRHGPHDDALAYELGVTRHLLRVWRSTLERTHP